MIFECDVNESCKCFSPGPSCVTFSPWLFFLLPMCSLASLLCCHIAGYPLSSSIKNPTCFSPYCEFFKRGTQVLLIFVFPAPGAVVSLVWDVWYIVSTSMLWCAKFTSNFYLFIFAHVVLTAWIFALFYFLDLNQLKFYLSFKAHLCRLLYESFPDFFKVIFPFFEILYTLYLFLGPYHVTPSPDSHPLQSLVHRPKEEDSWWNTQNMNDVFFYIVGLSGLFDFPS